MKEEFIHLMHRKYVAVLALLCLVAACAVAVYNGHKNQQIQNSYVLMEESEAETAEAGLTKQQAQADGSSEALTGEQQAQANGSSETLASEQQDVQAGADVGQSQGADEQAEETVEETTISEEERQAAQVAAMVEEAGVSFDAQAKLTWPVSGQVVKEFSMEETTYFPTLNEYKCNPGLLIQGDVGTPVSVPAKAVVTAVGENEEIGQYITLALGKDYQLTLGQLTAVSVEKGDVVESGAVVANIAEPTSYYTLEGSHVYVELQKDGVSVDPLDYME